MEQVGIHSVQVVDAARELVKLLVRAIHTVRLYDARHPAVQDLAEPIVEQWVEATQNGPLVLSLHQDNVMLEDATLHSARAQRDVLPTTLYEEGILGLVLRPGMDGEEMQRLLQVLGSKVKRYADYGSALWEAGLPHLDVIVDEEGADEPVSADTFVDEVAHTGDEQDPPAGEDYEKEQEALGRMLDGPARGLLPPILEGFVPTAGELLQIESLVRDDSYRFTIRHVGLVLDDMVRRDPSPEEQEALAEALQVVLAGTLASDDVTMALDLLDRADQLRHTDAGRAYAARIGSELARPEHLHPFLLRVEQLQGLDTHRYEDLLVRLGAAAVPAIAAWLLRTSYPEEVSRALCFHGHTAVPTLAKLLDGADEETRERVVPILTRVGTPEALLALAGEMEQLPEHERAKLVAAAGDRHEPDMRDVLLQALHDPSERVRRAGVHGLRREDCLDLAPVLEHALQHDLLESRGEQELNDLFEKLSRIADASVALVLAEPCRKIGMKGRLFGLTPLQMLCLRALRGMRAPDARDVVDELRTNAPKIVREALDDPLRGLDLR